MLLHHCFVVCVIQIVIVYFVLLSAGKEGTGEFNRVWLRRLCTPAAPLLRIAASQFLSILHNLTDADCFSSCFFAPLAFCSTHIFFTVWQRQLCTPPHSCTIFLCYLGMEIDIQCKDLQENNKDCRVGQLTNSVTDSILQRCKVVSFHWDCLIVQLGTWQDKIWIVEDVGVSGHRVGGHQNEGTRRHQVGSELKSRWLCILKNIMYL